MDYLSCAGKGTSEIIEKKSRFLGEAVRIESLEEAEAYIADVRKKYFDARHHCFAFIVGTPGTPEEIMRSGDDGEPQGTAGKPMLEILTGQDLHNTLVVVTRYFGGTLLGTGGLARAYSAAAKEAVRDAGLVRIRAGLLIGLTCSYPSLGKFQYLFAQEGWTISDISYEEQVTMEIMIPAGDLTRIKALVTETTGGGSEAIVLDEISFEETIAS